MHRREFATRLMRARGYAGRRSIARSRSPAVHLLAAAEAAYRRLHCVRVLLFTRRAIPARLT